MLQCICAAVTLWVAVSVSETIMILHKPLMGDSTEIIDKAKTWAGWLIWAAYNY